MKVRPTISGAPAVYLRDIANLGLWGRTPGAVARELVREGIVRALEHKLIKTRRFDERGNEEKSVP